MMNLLWVGAGGFIGATARYSVAALMNRWVGRDTFPWATLTVNMVGCFVIGLLAVFFEKRWTAQPAATLFVFAGFLGSFTTFSTFGYDTVMLVQRARPLAAVTNGLAQLVCGCLLVAMGMGVGRLLRY